VVIFLKLIFNVQTAEEEEEEEEYVGDGWLF